MNLICIKNINSSPITPGKMYFDSYFIHCLGPNQLRVLILNDDGYSSWELKENFIDI